MLTSETFEFKGKTMVPGTEFSITGVRGTRFRFLNYVQTEDAEWINAINLGRGPRLWRSFRPSQINRVTKLMPLPPREAINAGHQVRQAHRPR